MFIYVRDYLTFWDPVWVKVIYTKTVNCYLLLLLFYISVLSDEALRNSMDYQERVWWDILYVVPLTSKGKNMEGVEFLEF